MIARTPRLENNFGISRLQIGRLIGPAAMIGGVLLIAMAAITGFDVGLAGIAALLVFAAVIGRALSDPEPTTGVARAGLVVAVAGMALTVVGWGIYALGVAFGLSVFAWGFFFGLHGGVLLVETGADRTGGRPRWNALQFAGGPFVLAGLVWLVGFSLWGSLVPALLFLGGLGWAAFGYGRRSARGEESGAPDSSDDRAGGDADGDDGPDPTAERFRVSGRVALADGSPAAGVLVRAFDRDLRSLERLGETRADDSGRYAITYAPEGFRRAEKERADLIVRAYDEVGTDVAESETVFNAAPDRTIDLEIDSGEAPASSEYERLRAELRPLLDGIALRELTDDDVDFLAGETGLDERREAYPAGRESVELLSTAAGLSAETTVGLPVFYALGRHGYDLNTEALGSEDPDALRDALVAAIDENVVPSALRDTLDDEIDRLRSLGMERRLREREAWDRREVTVRLVDETDDPLEGYAVELTDPAVDDLVQTDAQITDPDGEIPIAYRAPPDDVDAEPSTPRRELTVLDHRGDAFHRETILLDDEVVVVRLSPLEPPETGDDGARIPDETGESSTSDRERSDDSIGQLRLITDSETGRTLADRGYSSPADIARDSPAAFAREVGDVIGSEEATRIRSRAGVQTAVLDSLVTDDLTNAANRGVLARDEATCDPHESGVSPRAYLTALLEYAEAHVTEPGEGGGPAGQDRPLDPELLAERFSQPFDALATDAAADEPVRHVRLVVESLLGHLGEETLGELLADPGREVAATAARYSIDAYDELLRQWGTSPGELRAAAHDDEERAAIAARLGIEPGRVVNDDPTEDISLDADASRESPDALTQGALERLFGLPAMVERADGSVAIRDPLADVDEPAIRTWRIEHLRRTWTERDRPTDAYSRGERPVVDPDVIGPDDFRRPDPDASGAFGLWVKRREWTDEQLAAVREAVPDVESTVAGMSDPLRYGETRTDGAWPDGTDPAALEALSERLSADDADEARERVWTDLSLEPDGLVRLVDLLKKHRTAERHSGDAVTDEEWREFTSILVGARKAHLSDIWVDEEVDRFDGVEEPGDLLDPRTFRLAEHEPGRGEWSSWIDARHGADDRPFVDPERLGRDDLPDATAGRAARRFYESRTERLEDFRGLLAATYEGADAEEGGNPFDAVLDAVYGGPPTDGPFAADDWGEYLDALRAALDDSDPEAEASLRGVLRLSSDELSVLATIRRRVDPEFDGAPPSALTLDEGFGALTGAWKRRTAYPDWIDAERDAGITTYWRALKARLPPWRAPREVRREWQRALRVRRSAPIVDPDHLDSEDYFVGEANEAVELRAERADRLAELADSIGLDAEAGADAEAFEAALVEHVGLTPESLHELANRRARDEDVSARLDQLDLSASAFSYLVEIDDKLAGETPITERERADVRAILVQVRKRRLFGRWRREERANDVTLRPELFARPGGTASPPGDDPMRWRVDARERRRWESTLERREEALDGIDVQVREAIEAAEEEALPRLRDALVGVLDTDGDDPSWDEKAEWASDRLLIDVRAGSCREATRVGQAIESLQTLVFALDIGRSDTGIAELELELSDEHFEERWEWLGAYERWKAAMGVYLYPENVLLPTLRRTKTPQFERIAESLTTAQRLSEADATSAAESYSRYFETLCGLRPEAACLLEYPRRSPRDPALLGFVFASSTVSDEIYFRSFDATAENPAEADSYWDVIPVLETIEGDRVDVLGAATYAETVYLFLKSSGSDGPTLGYVRYGAESADWSAFEPIDLPAIENGEQEALHEIAVVQTEGTTSPPELVVQREYSIGDSEDTWFQTLHGAFDGGGEPPAPDEFGNVPVAVFEESRQMPLEAAVRHGDHVYVVVYYWTDSGYRRRCLEYDPETERVATFRTYDIWEGRVGSDGIGLSPGSNRIFVVAARGGRIDTITLGEEFEIEESSHRFLGYPGQTTNELTHCNNPTWDLATGSETAFLDAVFIRRGVWHSNHRDRPDDWTYNSYLESVRLERSDNDRFDYERRQTGIGPIVRSSLEARRWVFGVDSTDATAEERHLNDLRHTSRLTLEAHQLPHMRSTVPYVAEAFYHVPLLIARQLTQSGNYDAALEWFRTIYDYTRVDVRDAQIWHGLAQERPSPAGGNGTRIRRIASGTDWLRDPMNPHSMAEGRTYPHTQFTVFSIVQCLLDAADEEFTREMSSSIGRARSLYELTLDLLDELADELGLDKRERAGVDPTRVASDPEDRATAGDRLTAGSAADRRASTRRGRHASLLGDASAVRALQELGGSAEEAVPQVRGDGGSLDRGQQRSTPAKSDRPASDGGAPLLQALAGFDTLRIASGFCVRPNPFLRSLRLHATSHLEKIRDCRNISGLERDQGAAAASGGLESAVPPAADGRISVPSASIQPTTYRYDTLIVRAKELVNLARQIESEFFGTLERQDQEAYQLKRARQDIDLARSGVRLQELRLDEAQDNVEVTEIDRGRSDIRLEYYTELLQTGTLELEEKSLKSMEWTKRLHTTAAGLHGAGAIHDAVKATFSFGLLGDPAKGAAAAASSGAAAFSTRASIFSTRASYERREREWEHQKLLAEHDRRIGSQQIRLARSRVDIVSQERDIAQLETTHAEDIVTFHETKFTNRELYQWMSGVLERVFRYFLQQATSTAKLAETQLAFERQERPPSIIKSGYWEPPRAAGISAPGRSEDRRGLTGPARLLEDIHRLDQYEFETDERMHRVEKTVSLARHDPIALQRFRETGVLQFGTPMELFDRDHPGQYLRLIKRVDASVVALTPPTEGVKATLTASGVSRVVVGDRVFRKRVIRRQPESIVLRASQRREGVVDLRPEDEEKLRPFENTGVETSWELRMPKPANQFDYDTVADVLVTIEFAALESEEYRRQVIAELDPRESTDRVFSFKSDFADQWYDLHNPEQTAEPMTVRFETDRGMFPPNRSNLEIEDVQLYFLGREGAFEGGDVSLTFAERGEAGRVGGVAAPVDGVIRTPTASSWNSIRSKRPAGEWTLSFPDADEASDRFAHDTLEDVLFVVTVSGDAEDWPD